MFTRKMGSIRGSLPPEEGGLTCMQSRLILQFPRLVRPNLAVVEFKLLVMLVKSTPSITLLNQKMSNDFLIVPKYKLEFHKVLLLK